MNQVLYKISLIKEISDTISNHKQILLDELIDNATDPVIRMRRIRMLHQLAQYESDVIRLVDQFNSQDPNEWTSNNIIAEIESVVNRSA